MTDYLLKALTWLLFLAAIAALAVVAVIGLLIVVKAAGR